MKTTFVSLLAFSITLFTPRAFADRTLEHQATIAAPIGEVWNAWTTNEGFTSWAVKKAEIDLRIGGDMRTSYNPQSTLHDEHTIVNRIISFEPQRMLAIKNVQAPANFRNEDLFQKTWTVISLDPIAGDRTLVRIAGMGYGQGPEWDDIYNKFKVGNQWTLDRLREKFSSAAAKDADDAAEVLKILGSMVGGDWIHEDAKPDGAVFRVRNQLTFAPDGRSICARGWLGDAAGMFEHSATQIWREPASVKEGPAGPARFQNINEAGQIARGEIHLSAPNQIQWDWLAASSTGSSTRYCVTQTMEDADHYRFVLALADQTASGGAAKELVNVRFTRVKELPAAFSKMKPKD